MKTSVVLRPLAIILILAIALGTSRCKKYLSSDQSKVPPGHTGVRLMLTDDPSLVLDHLFLDIQKVEIKVEDSAERDNEREHQGESDDNDRHGGSGGGWMALDIHPGIYDILAFRNGLDTLLANGSFQTGLAFKKIRIMLGSNNSVVLDGTTFPLPVQAEDRWIVIKTEDFEIDPLGSSDFEIWLDLDAGRSVRRHGHDFEFKPEIRLFSKDKGGSIEGHVLPAAAAPIVIAINGTDSLTAKPDAEGEFKIRGLDAGSWTLWIHATANGYQDSTLTQVRVTGNEDTNVGTIALHQ